MTAGDDVRAAGWRLTAGMMCGGRMVAYDRDGVRWAGMSVDGRDDVRGRGSG